MKGLAGLFAVSTYAQAKKNDKRTWAEKMGINIEKEKWAEEVGAQPQPLNHFHIGAGDLPHPSQTWAIGDFLFFEDEWIQFWEYLTVDAANRKEPGSRWTGIDGPWLRTIGLRRWNDPDARALLGEKES